MAQLIIKGTDVDITVFLINKATGKPYPLENFVSASGFMKNQDGTTQMMAGQLMSADLGEMKFPAPKAVSQNFEANEAADFEVFADNGIAPTGVRVGVQFIGQFNVVDTIFNEL